VTAGIATLRDDDIGACGRRLFGLRQGCTWQMILHPAALIRPVNGVGSPKDSIIAAGLASSATSRAAGLRSSAQVIKPMPTRVLPASPNS
jgi:hypothetical protein